MSKASAPAPAQDVIVSSISKDASDLVEEKQIVGRKIWRVLPYVTRYWERALGGLLANIGARIFDLIPFIAIGMAADYYNPDNSQFTNSAIENFVTLESIPNLGPIDSTELGFGLLIFSSFVFLGLIGISNGLANVLGSATWAEIYGVKYIGSIKALTTALMVFSTAFGTALFGILIDNGFSIEQIALVSGSYILIAISLLFIIKSKLNPQYL